MKKLLFILFAILCIAIGVYPAIYTVMPEDQGLLATKTPELLADPVWRTFFILHITGGGLALIIGWTQFAEKWRVKRLSLHRLVGKIHVIAAVISGLASLYIVHFATGGMVSTLGFASLGIIWLSTTLLAFVKVRAGDIQAHRRLMTFSYAACFAAVTLRLWLPLLTTWIGEFVPAYQVVSWLCWVPNMLVAAVIVRKNNLPAT